MECSPKGFHHNYYDMYLKCAVNINTSRISFLLQLHWSCMHAYHKKLPKPKHRLGKVYAQKLECINSYSNHLSITCLTFMFLSAETTN